MTKKERKKLVSQIKARLEQDRRKFVYGTDFATPEQGLVKCLMKSDDGNLVLWQDIAFVLDLFGRD